VYTEALAIDHPERAAAQKRGIRSVSYFRALGDLSEPYNVVAVSGTHGKSSTTGLLAKVLIDAGKDPTVIVGTKLPDLDGRNWRAGKSDLFLLEACEYRRSFHALTPDTIVITTVDGDHYDYYASLDDYHRAFVEFAEQLPLSGSVVVHGEDGDAVYIVESASRMLIDADRLPLPELSVPGLHMRQNAQLALAAAEHLGVDRASALASLRAYRGAWRRMELVGMFQDIPVIDDYGHHPREIAATLQATAEKYPTHRIVCVFQPHTHDRTLKLYKDFTKAFHDADLVIIPGIYDARPDRDAAAVDLDAFAKDIAIGSDTACRNGGSLAHTEQQLREEILQSGDVLLVMGAGDVTGLARRIGTGK
jgi:UDP-N-acetylmuramate--alanine ligase